MTICVAARCIVDPAAAGVDHDLASLSRRRPRRLARRCALQQPSAIAIVNVSTVPMDRDRVVAGSDDMNPYIAPGLADTHVHFAVTRLGGFMREQTPVDMSAWESWQREYRYGVILVMPPPHVAAPIDALRQVYDPKSHAICSTHISVSDPLRRELTRDGAAEIRELLRTVEPFEVRYDRPIASAERPGVACPVGPQERFDELKRVLHKASVFEGVVSGRRAIPAHMTIAEFLTIEDSLRICAEVADTIPPGSFRCDRLESMVPDTTFRFHRRETFLLGA